MNIFRLTRNRSMQTGFYPAHWRLRWSCLKFTLPPPPSLSFPFLFQPRSYALFYYQCFSLSNMLLLPHMGNIYPFHLYETVTFIIRPVQILSSYCSIPKEQFSISYIRSYFENFYAVFSKSSFRKIIFDWLPKSGWNGTKVYFLPTMILWYLRELSRDSFWVIKNMRNTKNMKVRFKME